MGPILLNMFLELSNFPEKWISGGNLGRHLIENCHADVGFYAA